MHLKTLFLLSGLHLHFRLRETKNEKRKRYAMAFMNSALGS